MKRVITRLGACTALLLAVFAVSCDDGPTTVPEVAQTTAPDVTPETPLFDIEPATLNCMGDQALVAGIINGLKDPYDLNCVANDTKIGFVTTTGAPITCIEDDPVEVNLTAELVANADTRYDVGVWLAKDGGDAISGECEFRYLFDPLDATETPTVPKFPCGPDEDGDGTPDEQCEGTRESPFWNAELTTQPGDLCGDMEQNIQNFLPFGVITLTCKDSNDDGFLDATGCIAYHNSADTEPLCTAANADEATTPQTRSKCRCRPLKLDVNVKRAAKVIVNKTVVNDDGSRWTLTVESPSLASDVTDNVLDGGSIEADIEWFKDDEPGANKATVTEAFFDGGASDGGFYTSTYSCDSTNDAHDISTTTGRSIPEFTDLVNKEVIECTFVNTRIPVPVVTIDKTVATSYDRDWTWTITKKAFDQLDVPIPTGTALDLAPGEVYVVSYEVDVLPDYTDSNIQASGEITVTLTGNAVYETTAFSVTDVLSDATAITVNCPTGPFTADPGGTDVVCTWTHNFTGVDDVNDIPSDLSNSAEVDLTWNSTDECPTECGTGGSAGPVVEAITFGDPDDETNKTATVTDDKGTASDVTLGSADAANSNSWHFEYDNPTPACVPPGSNRLNTATVTPDEGGTPDQAQHALSWACAFQFGCVLTQGYWKTHSEFGPAPYDDTWLQVTGTGVRCPGQNTGPRGVSLNSDGNGADFGASVAFDTNAWPVYGPGPTTNMCYFTAMWKKHKGDLYYQLARQYVAAQLNALTADSECVAEALEAAQAVFAGGDGIKGNDPRRAEAQSLISILTDYNEGYLCADSCDDDGLTEIFAANED